MPNPIADEARALNDNQLAEAVNEAYRELFNLQFQKGTRQLQDATAIPRTRRQIARLRTIQRERQIAEVLGAPLEPVAAPAEAAISPQKQRALDERAALEAEEETAASDDIEAADEVEAEDDVEAEADDDEAPAADATDEDNDEASSEDDDDEEDN